MQKRLPYNLREESPKLKHFTATLAHWRYETLEYVLGELKKLELIAIAVRLELFANPQDRDLV